jgi:hypothetical protein
MKTISTCCEFRRFFLGFIIFALCVSALNTYGQEDSKQSVLQIALFDIDVTPPVGTYMAYQPVMQTWDMSLRARGIVLLGTGAPIVLLAVDCIGICNESQDVIKNALAKAAGTIPERVAVHSLHQHDAPRFDFSTERILKSAGLKLLGYEGSFTREVVKQLEASVSQSLSSPKPVTQIGYGEAQVYEVASSRNIFGEDGKVKTTRYSASPDPAKLAAPEGLIDPMVTLVSFWNNNKPLAVLSYYATHPQSYFMTGVPNPDFPGIARFFRQLEVPDALHVHFNGAGGNVGPGKYNNGSKENRGILARRLADGMKRAWESTRLEPVTPSDIVWKVEPIVLPLAEDIVKMKSQMNERLKDTSFLLVRPWNINARKLALLQRYEEGNKIDISCLSLGNARILHLPGELSVEFQLAAKKMRPDLFVSMAAYGDCGFAYICTAKAYTWGGYESESSFVSPEAEGVIMAAIRKLLEVK